MSPFRYPGGKAFFADALSSAIKKLPGGITAYLEPFAGGAGAAIRLLGENLVDKIYLNDADIRIYHAWRAMTEENSRFLEELANVKLDIGTWYEKREIVKNPGIAKDGFELGFATFFLNRTNRSGIIIGAGPIGGFNQLGKWKIDARFNRSQMRKRIEWIGKNAARIEISNDDGLNFIKKTSSIIDTERSLYFIDPPYVGAGSRLYMNGMRERDHILLGAYLCSGIIPNWIVTYDDCPLIRNSYEGAVIHCLEVLYSLQTKRLQNEVLITPNLWPNHLP